MADFTSEFWSWFIIVIVLGGMFAMLWILYSNNIAGEAKPTGHVWDEDLVELNNPLPSWWLWMFVITVLFSFVYLAVYPGLGSYKGYFGWSQVGQYEDEVKVFDEATAPLYAGYMARDIEDLATDEKALQTGGRIFASYCAVCHGSDAGGAKGYPNLRDTDWLYGGSASEIETSILKGRNGAMPPFGAAVGGEEGAEQIASYVLSLSGRKHAVSSAAEGKAKFAMVCAGCHGADAKGNKWLGAPNLTDKTWLYGGSKRTIVKTIMYGRQGTMPAHADFLGKEKVHVVAAYVYSLSQKK